MNAHHEQAIRQAAALAFHLAAIERALEVAEANGQLAFLPDAIRQQLRAAETVAAADLTRCRQLLRGDR